MELLGGCLSGALPFFLELNEAGKRAAEEDSMKLDVLLTKIGAHSLQVNPSLHSCPPRVAAAMQACHS